MLLNSWIGFRTIMHRCQSHHSHKKIFDAETPSAGFTMMLRMIFLMLPARASNDLTCMISDTSKVDGNGVLEVLESGKTYYKTVAGAEFIV